jgi:tetratricopeptide (TPR) repeat protein
VQSWPIDQARRAESREDWFAAAFYLTQLIDRDPKEATLRARRAIAFAQRGQWPQACADWHQARQLADTSFSFRYHHGLALLGNNDTTGYQSVCREMLRRLKDLDTRNAGFVAQLAALRADSVDEPSWAELRQVVQGPQAQFALPEAGEILGAVCYRAGDYEAARRHLVAAARTYGSREASRQDATPSPALASEKAKASKAELAEQRTKLAEAYATVWTQLFLAMTHHQLKAPQEAQRWLELAQRQIESDPRLQVWPSVPDVPNPTRLRSLKIGSLEVSSPPRRRVGWHERLRRQLLLAEARELLGVAHPEAKKP